MQEILLNVESKEVRYAYLKHGLLYDLVIDRKKSRQITGNVYRGRVTNILHNIQSAFIDINEGENGFIHISDILENTKKFEEMFEMDFDLDYDISKMSQTPKAKDIAQLLKIDQPVLVQVVKEPIGTKERASPQTFRSQAAISSCCRTIHTEASRGKSKIKMREKDSKSSSARSKCPKIWD